MSIDIHLVLCDAASNDSSGKVHMLGAGWSIMQTPTTPHAVVALVSFPATEHAPDTSLPVTLCLRGPDNEPVTVKAGDRELPLHAEGSLTVKRPPVGEEFLADAPVTAVYSLSVAPLPLAPGRYRWCITVGDAEGEAPFLVIDPPHEPAQADVQP